MLFERISVLTQEGILRDQYVGVRGEKIVFVGPQKPQEDLGRVFDGRGKLLLPGFVNAHSHIPMILMRGYGENLPLGRWLNEKIFPFEAKIGPQDAYWATLLGIAEMVRFGITSTTDMYYHLPQMAQAFIDAGVKVNLCNGAMCFDDTPYERQNSHVETAALLEKVGRDHPLVRVDMGVHAEYTSDERTVRAVVEEAETLGLRIQVHLSETRSEHEEGKVRRGGRTPARYLADCGVFDVPATAAHCVWIEEGDFEILGEKNVTIASCPKSNLKLGSGVFDVRSALSHGVRVAVGTDSVASNNSLNMIEEIRTFMLLHKGVSGDPVLLTPVEAFTAATRSGALSQGRDDCGAIAPGMRADLCVLDQSAPWEQPVYDPLVHAAFTSGGTGIVLTMVNGRVVYDDGVFPTIDVERAAREVELSRKRICGQIGDAR